jgi:hypothetical protein
MVAKGRRATGGSKRGEERKHPRPRPPRPTLNTGLTHADLTTAGYELPAAAASPATIDAVLAGDHHHNDQSGRTTTAITATPAQRRRPGRPLGSGVAIPYTPELGRRVCAAIAAGYKLTEIARWRGMPAAHILAYWSTRPDRYPDFVEAYRRARRAQGEVWLERLIEIAEGAHDRDTAQAARVKVDVYRWVLSKLHPERYGDRLDLGVSGQVHVLAVAAQAPTWLAEAIAQALAGANSAVQRSADTADRH